MLADESQDAVSVLWTEWQDLSQSSATNEPAIYEIRIVDENGTPLRLGRFLDLDELGLISIGLTTDMERRRQQFLCGMDNCYGHSEGNLLNLLRRFSRLQEVFPAAKYQYRFQAATNADVPSLERRAIKRYIRRFGEVPPLNSAIPARYDLPSWQEEMITFSTSSQDQTDPAVELLDPNGES